MSISPTKAIGFLAFEKRRLKMLYGMSPHARALRTKAQLWLGAWGVTFILIGKLLEKTDPSAWYLIPLGLVPVVVGAIAIWRYWGFLQGADELFRKIETEGTTLALMMAGVAYLAYLSLMKAGLPRPELAVLLLGLVVLSRIGHWIAARRLL